METKLCRCSPTLKPITDFPFRNKARGLRASDCRDCRRKYVRSHYNRNKQHYRDKEVTSRAKVVAENRTKLLSYLAEHPCIDCGETDVVVLDFDHVRGEKLGDVATMVCQKFSWETISKEIEKCVVRCANDHRRKTARERSTYRF